MLLAKYVQRIMHLTPVSPLLILQKGYAVDSSSPLTFIQVVPASSLE